MPCGTRVQKLLTMTLVLYSLLGVSCTLPTQPDSIQDVEALVQQVVRLRSAGRDSEAIPLMQKLLATEEQRKGPEHLDTAASLYVMAVLYHHTGAYAQAEPLYQRALAIREKVLGAEHPDTATSLNNLAALYGATGAYGKAEPLVQRALATNEKVLEAEHPDTAVSLYVMGELYRATGAYGKAEPLVQRALAINEKVLGPEHPNTATLLNNLAMLYHHTGAYAKAEPLYQRALAIREKVLGPEHPDTATSLSELAGLYRDTGAYAQAVPLLERTLTMQEKVLGPDHPDTATSLNKIAELHRRTGAYAQAEPLYQRALTIREKVLGLEHPETSTSLNNLAVLYQATGAYGQAEPLLQRALAIGEKVLGPEHPDTATTLNNLANLYQDMGDYAQAERLYQGVVAIQEKALGPEHPDTASALENLASLYWATNDLLKARSVLSRADAIQERQLSTFLLTGSESRKHAFLVRMHGKTSMNISLSLNMLDGHARALGFLSVLTIKGRVLDAMSESLAHLRASVKPEDRVIVEELMTVAQQRSTLTYQGIGNLKPEVYRQRLQELIARQEHLETDLSAQSAEFRQQIALVTLPAVKAAIPKNAALVEWYRYAPFDPKGKDPRSRWGKPRYAVYVLGHEGEPVVVDVGEAESIDRLVQDFRAGLSDRASTYVKDVAKDLYEKLYKPLQLHLGNAHQLLLSPDGALNFVPFAALRDDTGTYLGAKKYITYLTSGRDLLGYGTTPAPKSEMVVVANPDYGPSAEQGAPVDSSLQPTRSLDLDRGGMTFTPLPGTAEEAKTLKALLKISDDHMLTQANATEEQFKQLHGPRILHVATHGFFLKDNELPAAALKPVGFTQDHASVALRENSLLRSGLALAGANQRRSGEKDDGILTAAEVAQMDLRGTQLVVLSACETGVGDVQNGEGVYGLRRALVLAGAESQVTSLWKVADEATKDLMMDYYKRLLRGEGRSEALRNAQLTMMKSKDRSHPYYWAAFVPIGDWRPLAKVR